MGSLVSVAVAVLVIVGVCYCKLKNKPPSATYRSAQNRPVNGGIDGDVAPTANGNLHCFLSIFTVKVLLSPCVSAGLHPESRIWSEEQTNQTEDGAHSIFLGFY